MTAPNDRPRPESAHLFAERLTTIFLLLLLLSSIARMFELARGSTGPDFYQYWIASKSVHSAGISDIYSDANRAEIGAAGLRESASGSAREKHAAHERTFVETYSPPFLYALAAPLSYLPYETAYWFHQVFSLLCGAAAIFILGRLFSFSTPALLTALVLLTDWFVPFLVDVKVGNVDRIQLLLLVGFLAVRRRPGARSDIAAGVLLGASVMFKPNLLPVPVMLNVFRLADLRWRDTVRLDLGLLGGALGAYLLTSLYFGTPQVWLNWIPTLSALPQEIIATERANYSFALLFFGNASETAAGFLALVFLTVAALAAWMSRRKTEASTEEAWSDDALALSIGALITLLAPRLVWVHYFMLAVPAIFLAFSPHFRLRGVLADRTRLVVASLALLTISMYPVRALFSVKEEATMALITFFGTLALFLLVLGLAISSRTGGKPARTAGDQC